MILIAAGGTGGHLFPAEALGAALQARDVPVALVTDARAENYQGKFPGEVHRVSSDTLRGRSPLAVARTAASLGGGLLESRRLIKRLAPKAVVGFGGYPTFPPMIAAMLARVPTVLHEANAVMGQANRMLAKRVTCVAAGFPLEDAAGARRVVVTGNPVRPAVTAAALRAYAPPEDEFRLLVFGGSQGARVMADVVPAALTQLTDPERVRFRLVFQAREEDVARVRAALAAINVSAEVASFFPDMPSRIADAHLVISRAGASTVTELAVIGRPAIVVPFPHAQDHQASNPKALAHAGGAIVMAQSAFTPDRAASLLAELAAAPERLAGMAVAARGQANPDAATRLADLVLEIANSRKDPRS